MIQGEKMMFNDMKEKKNKKDSYKDQDKTHEDNDDAGDDGGDDGRGLCKEGGRYEG